jgi:hypothetical protein
MPLSSRRLRVILSTDRYPAIRSALLARWSRSQLGLWANGTVPNGAARLELSSMSGALIPRDGWAIARAGRKAA